MYQRLPRVTAAASQHLTSLMAVKLDLDISTTTASDDAYLTRMIAAASADAAKYCNRVFLQETVEDTFFLDRCLDKLILSRAPANEIVSVTADGTLLDDALYTVDTDAGLLFRLDSDGDLSEWDESKIVVVFKGGFASVPADLETAVVALIKARRAGRKRDPTVRSVRVPDVIETTYWVRGPGEADLPPDVAGAFDRYRMINV